MRRELDVLDAFDRIRLCVAYELDGKLLSTVPPTPVLERVKPVYEDLEGWRTSTAGLARYADLPQAARAFVRRIQELCGVPVTLIGTGARREHTIHTPGGVS